MSYGRRCGTGVLVFLLSWAAIWFLAAALAAPDDSRALLAGLVVAMVAAAALVLAWRADNLIFGLGRTTRGPTSDEQRLHGAFRRQSHPDTPGRPRPRAPGSRAGAALPASA